MNENSFFIAVNNTLILIILFFTIRDMCCSCAQYRAYI
jgi:hypothetical protein